MQRAIGPGDRSFDQHGADNFAAVTWNNAGTNGIVAPDSFGPGCARATRARGVYLIADEIMSVSAATAHRSRGSVTGCRQAGPDDPAKGLTGAHIPLGAVVVGAPVARLNADAVHRSDIAAIRCRAQPESRRYAHEDGKDQRSRRLGASMFAALQALQQRHACIGDVRGGDGLFAVCRTRATAIRANRSRRGAQTSPALRTLVDRARDAGVSSPHAAT
jgi:taurine--2-oxoglutarate transaminase